jgi:hypothetical protein
MYYQWQYREVRQQDVEADRFHGVSEEVCNVLRMYSNERYIVPYTEYLTILCFAEDCA